MAFNVSYNFIANNQFSGVAKDIKKSGSAIKKSMKGVGKELVITDSITRKASRSINSNFKKSSAVGQISSKSIVKSTKLIGRELVKTQSMSKIASVSVDASFKKIASSGKQSSKKIKRAFRFASKDIIKQLKKIGVSGVRSLRKFGRSIVNVISKLKRLRKSGKQAGSSLAGNFKRLVIGAGVFLGIKKAITVGADFQDSLADLSAITGATGKDLSLLTNKTLSLAKASATVQTEVAGAIKIVASQKAELLKNIPALVGVTEQVLLLKNAAGIDLAEAATIVTQSLNIFGAEASETARFVNVLAAGAKFGASEIADTGRAVVLAGAKARAAGIGFEDLNSIIQAVAKGGFKGAQAGTALSAIIGRLTRQGIDFRKSGIAGGFQMVKDAIDATIDPTKKALFIAKIFGEEHDKVGLSILNNIELLDTMSKSITGTKVAQEQAQIRLGTFNSKMRKLGVIVKDRVIRVFNRLEPVLTKLATRFGKFIDSITPEQLNKFGDDLKIFVKDAVKVSRDIASALKAAFTTENITEFKEGLSTTLKVLNTMITAGKLIASVFKGVGTSIGESAAALSAGKFGEGTPLAQQFAVGGKLLGVIKPEALESVAFKKPSLAEPPTIFNLIKRVIALKTAESLRGVVKPEISNVVNLPTPSLIVVNVATPEISNVVNLPKPEIPNIVNAPLPQIKTPEISKVVSFPKTDLDLGKSLPEIRQGPTIGEGGDSKTTIDINLKAPTGTVESIKRRDTGNVKKLNVGMNMEAAG